MNHLLFMLLPILGKYNNDLSKLSEDERLNVEYMYGCMYSDNENICNASLSVMLQILRIANDIDSYTPEMVKTIFDKIKCNLNDEEKEIMDSFTYACINSLGVMNKDDEENGLKLKKERNDL